MSFANTFKSLIAKLKAKKDSNATVQAKPKHSDSAEDLFLWTLKCLMLFSFCGFCVFSILSFKHFVSVSHKNDHQTAKAVHHEVEEVGEEEDLEVAKTETHGEDHEDNQIVLGASPFPKSVIQRQDGQMEEDHDLIDPEVHENRGIASILKDDLKVDAGSRFVEISEIIAGTRAGQNREGVVLADIVLEVNSLEAQRKIESRQVEIKSLISGIVGEKKFEGLSGFGGYSDLKESIQREINHLVGAGTVRDVLFNRFIVK